MSATNGRAPVRMCVRCERTTEEPVLVREVHGNSGPGWNVYACPDCAPQFPPEPDALGLIEAAQRRRREEAHEEAGR